MAKILFIIPVVREEDEPRHVPYGIALLAALAIKEGHLVQIYDDNAWRQGEDVLSQVIKADDWDVIGAGGISTTHAGMKSICRLAKEHAPNALLVVGGGILTALPKEIMTLMPGIDIGVVGEAFITLNEILARLDAGNFDPAAVDGIIYRKSDGNLQLTRPRGLLMDLDSLPYPAYELFPLEEIYFKNSQHLFSEEGMLASRRLDINASYGCSLVCKFCFHLGISGDMKYVEGVDGTTDVLFDVPKDYSRDIRYHSAAYVVEMMTYLKSRFNVDFISFLDENLMTMDSFSKRTWMKDICEGMIAAGLAPACVRNGVPHDEHCHGIHWSGTSHATLCLPETLKLMRQAGCSHLVYGYESFSKQIMKRLGKGATPETNKRSFFWTLEAGIRPIPNQIIGFPTEDFDSLRDCMNAWKELGIVVKPFFATPYPGSMWYETYKARILEQYDNDLDKFLLDLGDATRITGVISHNFNAVELYGLRELMVNFDYKRIAEFEAEWLRTHSASEAIPAAAEVEDQWVVENKQRITRTTPIEV